MRLQLFYTHANAGPVILVSTSWYLIVVFSFLVTSTMKHLFLGLLVICVPSLVKGLFQSFLPIVKIGLFVIYMYVVGTYPLSDT